ncbi:MAG: GspH/FimT family pseudopilin [Pseudohongiellaceae bacterium]
MNSGSITQQAGFTIIELMIVATIAGILLAVSAPAFQNVISRTVVNSQTRTLLTAINYTRSEAIRRNIPVTLCASSNGSSCDADSWSDGWLVMADGNGGADEVLRVYEGPGSGSTVTFDAGDDVLAYDGMGFSRSTDASRQFVVCPADNDADNAQGIAISPTGRASRVRDGLGCGS